MKHLIAGVCAMIALLTTSCKEKVAEKKALPHQQVTSLTPSSTEKGGLVPSDEVCMVNNAYMGKKQLEVMFDGKTYYGCCEMCKERIPKDESVRTATDPYSKRTVDKAKAVIAITGDNGEVSYFENETTYNKYLKQLN
ncbi:hypothetical protein [Chryseobacterium timonianum]|uniref:hypothetical protein n=1 Tax=Chryseobacterium timonianum TaxID=1805473 RepID=UPI001F4B520D|nr:hypothetical protein [Chryseobacterium timonianum]